MSRYPVFDRAQLQLRPLAERQHDLTLPSHLPHSLPVSRYEHPDLDELVAAISAARQSGRPVLCMIGAHLIKQGLSGSIVELIEKGMVTHVATNGAGIIHDFELAGRGGTSEDVGRYIRRGEFGMWADTGRINAIACEAARNGEGLGEAVGRVIERERFPYRAWSIAAAGWRHGTPVTCHVGIGCDIIHQHPNCDGAALGASSYTDFLIFAQAITELEGGVFLNIGSAVTGPEVYLKALSMARNVARQAGCSLAQFTTAVFDLVPLPDDWRSGTAPKTQAQYYYRPWKTILIRTVADGGRSFYFCGDHRVTLPALCQRLREARSGATRPAA